MFQRQLAIGWTREQRMAAGLTLVIALGLVRGFMSSGPRPGCRGFTMSNVDYARMYANDYAESAFSMWQHNNRDRACPRRLSELNEYSNRKPGFLADPWGKDYRMTCDARGIRVWSLGEDGRNGTHDDVRSWE